jgi:hypothetical protein
VPRRSRRLGAARIYRTKLCSGQVLAVVDVTLRDWTRFSERVEAVRSTVRNPLERDEIGAQKAAKRQRF